MSNYITHIHIENFKCFNGAFKLNLNNGLNILVGDNESGKSTILEAINLGLTGVLNGKFLKNELTQYIFNNKVVHEYVESLKTVTKLPPPFILIEILLEGDNLESFEGDSNTLGERKCGLCYKIHFDNKFQAEYEELISKTELKTVPIEYYQVTWESCARESITARSIPLKAAFIDSSSSKFQNGSDIYISRIVKDILEDEDKVKISQVHREMKDFFMDASIIKSVNDKIKSAAKISDKEIRLSIDLSTKNAWEGSLMTYLDDVPFHYIGKGEQCIIKTNLALSHKKSVEANILLLEEPENHLSHTRLNQLINTIKANGPDKQIIVSTHSSFVANKLGLESLIFLNDSKTAKLNDLEDDTQNFFKKLSGYDTLRLLLCKKAILVEGDSDELIIQKAYMLSNNSKLPIENGIDVISVGTTFLRFLEIAEKIKKPVSVVTDNDGKPEEVKSKYDAYIGANAKDNIKICFDEIVVTGALNSDEKYFNYNTLEPKMLEANSLELFNTIFGTSHQTDDEMLIYMKKHKTQCALKILESSENIKFPQYIIDAIS